MVLIGLMDCIGQVDKRVNRRMRVCMDGRPGRRGASGRTVASYSVSSRSLSGNPSYCLGTSAAVNSSICPSEEAAAAAAVAAAQQVEPILKKLTNPSSPVNDSRVS